MKEIKGTLTDWRGVSDPRSAVHNRLTSFEVDNKLHRNMIAHIGMTRAFDEISGESTFFVHGKEIIGMRNGNKLYKRERMPFKFEKGMLILGLIMTIWPFLVYTLSAAPSLQSAEGFGAKMFAVLVGLLSVPIGLFLTYAGSKLKSLGSKLRDLESMAESENLKLVEL